MAWRWISREFVYRENATIRCEELPRLATSPVGIAQIQVNELMVDELVEF